MSIVARFAIEYHACLDAAGRPLGDALPALAGDTERLVELYRRMVFVRSFDAKAIALQRTGKLGTYASCLGHEAIHVAIGASLRREDVFAPMYREYAAQFARGVKPREVLLYWGGDERGSQFSGPRHDYAWCVPIATQCLHAAGAALSFRIRQQPRVALAVVGDGGSSKSDFYGAINMAGAMQLPLVLVIVNNQYAISIPRDRQSGSETLAQKALAGGLSAVQVDGNDLIASTDVLAQAIERARDGGGGTVVEAITYRLSDHTTADDARRYRPQAEVEEAWEREPLRRMRAFLEARGVWDEARENDWKAQCNAQVDAEVNAYLAVAPPPVEAMFDYLYAELPTDLAGQRAAAIALDAPRQSGARAAA